jgi:hypothetical protein
MQGGGFYNLARAEPDRVALVDPQHNTATAGDLLSAANRLTHGLP